jgi:ABC-2 type transport system ATP-binding protein
VLIINEGSIVAEDTPERLRSKLQSTDRVHIEVRRPSPDVTNRLQNIPGVQSVAETTQGVYDVECAPGSDHREELAATVIQGGWGLLELRQVSMSLEEVFLELTTSEDAAGDEDEAASGEEE